MTTARPLLVLVTGPPGAGKTTLARELAPLLSLPLVAKDDIKESLGDSLDKTSMLWSKRLGAATWDILFVLMERFGQAGASAIFESNFYPDLHRDRLADLVTRHFLRPFEVHCTADPETLARRCRERERHPVHHSNRPSVATMKRWMPKNAALELSGNVVRVDTSKLEPVDLDGIVAKVREAAGGL